MEQSEENSTDTEEAHSRDLLVLEEEARTKRRQLSKKLLEEHNEKRRKLESNVSQLEDECNQIDLKLQAEKEAVELVIQGLESRIDSLKGCLDGRKRHKTKAHKDQVARLQSLIKDMKEDLKRLKSERPSLEKTLEKLGGDKNNSRAKKTKNLAEALLKLVDREVSTFRKNRTEVANMQKELDDVYNDEELQALQKQLAKQEKALRDQGTKHLESVDNLQYEIKSNDQTRRDEGNITVSEMKTNLQREIDTFRQDVAEVGTAMKTVVAEEIKMQKHFKTKFEAKLSDQARDIQEERDELHSKLDRLRVMLNAIESAKKAVPKKTTESLEDRKGRNKDDLYKLNKMKSELGKQHKKDLKDREEQDLKYVESLELKLGNLSKEEKAALKKFEDTKKKLTQQINQIEKAIAALRSEMEKQNSTEIDKISELRGEVGKYNAISEMLQAAEKSLRDKFVTECKKLDQKGRSIDENNKTEMQNKEKELSPLSVKHKSFDQQMTMINENVSHKTKDIKKEIANLDKVIEDLRVTCANDEKQADKKFSTGEKKIEELKQAIESLKKSNEAERTRLKQIIENEKKDQTFANEQLRTAMHKAVLRKNEMYETHETQKKELLKQLEETEKCADFKHELEKKFELLSSRIQAIDKALEKIGSKHRKEINDIHHSHAQNIKDLSNKRDVHKSRMEKSAFVLQKAEDLEKVLATVKKELQKLKHVNDSQEREVEELEEELAAIHKHNQNLERQLETISKKKKDFLRAVTITSWSTEIQSHIDSNVGDNTDAGNDENLLKQHRQLSHDIFILRNKIAAANRKPNDEMQETYQRHDTAIDASSLSKVTSKLDVSDVKSTEEKGNKNEETSESSDEILETMHTEVDIYYQKDCDKCQKRHTK